MDLDPGFTDLGVLPCTLDAGIANAPRSVCWCWRPIRPWSTSSAT